MYASVVSSFTIAAISRNWKLHQFDVNNDFFHADQSEDVYVYEHLAPIYEWRIVAQISSWINR